MHDLLIALAFVSMVISPALACSMSKQPGYDEEEGEFTDQADHS